MCPFLPGADFGGIDEDGCLVWPWHCSAYDVTTGRMVRGRRGLRQGARPGLRIPHAHEGAATWAGGGDRARRRTLPSVAETRGGVGVRTPASSDVCPGGRSWLELRPLACKAAPPQRRSNQPTGSGRAWHHSALAPVLAQRVLRVRGGRLAQLGVTGGVRLVFGDGDGLDERGSPPSISTAPAGVSSRPLLSKTPLSAAWPARPATTCGWLGIRQRGARLTR